KTGGFYGGSSMFLKLDASSGVPMYAQITSQLGGLIRRGALPEFACYPALRPEFTYGHSRFDFWLSGRDVGCPASDLLAPPDCLVEVKSVTLMRDGVGLFPDAPTVRGRRHVTELAEAVRAGHRAAVVFVAQRSDVRSFVPNDALDPAFGAALRAAAAAGVEVHAYGCDVDRERIWLRQRLEVAL
ncbi:MAG: DNA/RNA nuclease SfsA, partial [Chloroflexi bacterium]|nr:DNA/RNA nuclease SfsA [Chloroflexota bacterium]